MLFIAFNFFALSLFVIYINFNNEKTDNWVELC